jgi:hypothetical protein
MGKIPEKGRNEESERKMRRGWYGDSPWILHRYSWDTP